MEGSALVLGTGLKVRLPREVKHMVPDPVLPDVSCSNFPAHMKELLLTHDFASNSIIR